MFWYLNMTTLTLVIIQWRVDLHLVDDDFEHLVAHVMSCTFESDVRCAMGYGVLRFGHLIK